MPASHPVSSPPTHRPAQSTSQDIVSGRVTRILFEDDATGYRVLAVATVQNQSVTVVGTMDPVVAGAQISAHGAWETNRDHGQRLRADIVLREPGSDREGILAYLSSEIPFIGPTLAQRLYNTFSDRVLDVCETDPVAISRTKGISAKRAVSIQAEVLKLRQSRKLVEWLYKHGLRTTGVRRILKAYGDQAIEKLSEDPYRLIRDVAGFGFDRADAIANRLGIIGAHPHRTRAGIMFAIDQARVRTGSSCILSSTLQAQVQKLLGVDRDATRSAIQDAVRSGAIELTSVNHCQAFGLARNLRLEERLANRLRRLASGLPPWLGRAPRRRRTPLACTPHQQEALDLLLGAKVAILRGGPGTGKTFVSREVIERAVACGMTVKACALAAKAAIRITEATEFPAQTVHKILGVGRSEDGEPGSKRGFSFKHNLDNPIDCDLIVVDEAYMLDMQLLADLLDAVPNHAAVLFVGDSGQIEPIGMGTPVADLAESGLVPVAELTEIRRQGEGSGITRAAHAINRGQMPQAPHWPNGDFSILEVPDADLNEAVTRVVMAEADRIGEPSSVQVLTPMKEGVGGVFALNTHLSVAINPSRSRRGDRPCPGDRVIQCRNNYDLEVMNGEVGFVLGTDEDGGLAVRYPTGEVTYDTDVADEIALAYALTKHKSQGSEYPVVVIVVSMAHRFMLSRNLLNTAITRGKERVVIVGSRQAIAQAARRTPVTNRITRLPQLLRAA